jgi:hypothetical protein
MLALKDLRRASSYLARPRNCDFLTRAKTVLIAVRMWLPTARLHAVDRSRHQGRSSSADAYVAVESCVFALARQADSASLRLLWHVVDYCLDIGLHVSGERYYSRLPAGSPPWWTAFHVSNAIARMLDMVEINGVTYGDAAELVAKIQEWGTKLTPGQVSYEATTARLVHLNALLLGSGWPRPVGDRRFCDFCGWR